MIRTAGVIDYDLITSHTHIPQGVNLSPKVTFPFPFTYTDFMLKRMKR